MIAYLVQAAYQSLATQNDTLESRKKEVISKLTIPTETMKSVKSRFLAEMTAGWAKGLGKGSPASFSSLKMLSSHVRKLPTGSETGAFYAIDLGGTNLRVLRVLLTAGSGPIIDEVHRPIPPEVMLASSTASDLFDFIAEVAHDLVKKHRDHGRLVAGFTFSFPMSQTSVRTGKLIEWTKGFGTRGVVGQDPAALCQEAMDRRHVPIKIVALCNDTVGTLMTCAYEFKGCATARVGVILGTGTNACYVDPSLDNLIVNIEWGGFNKGLPVTQFDKEIDRRSPNPGHQIFEKLISGMYLGEITRLATVYILGVETPAILADSTSFFSTAEVCKVLEGHTIKGIDGEAAAVLKEVGNLVLDRSASLAACALAAVAIKTGSFCERGLIVKRRDSVRKDGLELTIGIDGSLYIKGHRYKDRLLGNLAKLVGDDAVKAINIVHSDDGSGVGAALVAASVSPSAHM